MTREAVTGAGRRPDEVAEAVSGAATDGYPRIVATLIRLAGRMEIADNRVW